MIHVIEHIKVNPIYKFVMNLDNNSEIIAKCHNYITSERTCEKTLRFIKKNSDCISYILYMLPFTEILQLYQEHKLLYFHWTNEMIESLSKINKKRLIINIINNNNCLDELIMMNNSVSMSKNFMNDILRKRVQKFNNIANRIFFHDFYLGSNFVHVICDNFLSKQLYYGNKKYQFKIYSKKKKITIAKGKGEIYLNKSNSDEGILYVVDNFEIIIHHQYSFNLFPIFYNTDETFILDGAIISENDLIPNDNSFTSAFDEAEKEINAKSKIPHGIVCATFEGYQKLHNYFVPVKYSTLYYMDQFIWDSIILKSKIFVKRKDTMEKCYVCKKVYDTNIILNTYNSMCLSCAYFNYERKNLNADMRGMVAVVTGIRHKIGLHIALKLLRNGCKVVGTTRFPNAAWYNYKLQHDFDEWCHRLIIYKCDFLKLNEVNQFINYLKYDKINILINNACQTIRMTKTCLDKIIKWDNLVLEIGVDKYLEKDYINEIVYDQMDAESYDRLVCYNNTARAVLYPNWTNSDMKIIKTVLKNNGIIFNNFYDVKDTDYKSSWVQTMNELDPGEIMEVNLVNQIVPTLLVNKLKPQMDGEKFIINVVALEGQFNCKKAETHPHTNMCKAALNMMIRTLSEEPDPTLHAYAIDPGYVTGVNPQQESYPLSVEDGASRILDPIMQYLNNTPLPKEWTKLRNYVHTPW